jgi:aspartate-semialdehyde dehydrogenase
MLNILAEREFPVDAIAALASRKSLGTECSFGEKTLKTQDLDTFDFTGWDIAFFAIGSDATKKYAPVAAKAGCVVIDNSSLYRYDPEVPLIVPEVNPDAVMGYSRKNIIANPNCSTAQMVVALKPLHDRATIKRVVVSTYQSVSGTGKEAMDELWNQTKGIYVPGQEVEPKVYPKAGSDGRQRAEHVGGQRQPAQGRGAERGADRGTARPAGPEKGLTGATRGLRRPRRPWFSLGVSTIRPRARAIRTGGSSAGRPAEG